MDQGLKGLGVLSLEGLGFKEDLGALGGPGGLGCVSGSGSRVPSNLHKADTLLCAPRSPKPTPPKEAARSIHETTQKPESPRFRIPPGTLNPKPNTLNPKTLWV